MTGALSCSKPNSASTAVLERVANCLNRIEQITYDSRLRGTVRRGRSPPSASLAARFVSIASGKILEALYVNLFFCLAFSRRSANCEERYYV